MANLGAIPTFVGPGDAVFIDETSHACLWAGARLSGATIFTFGHNNTAHLSDLLGEHRALFTNALVLTEGVFSMDGDLAPLDEIGAAAQAHDAWLMTDDAHGVGVLADGRGSAALFPKARIDLQMGTLSKALASAGGYVCGSREAIDLLKTRARTVIYTTSLPPASAAAALGALDVIESDPELCATPLAKARAFTRAANLPEAQSPIVPIILGEPEAALEASRALEAEGFLVVAIRPPTVPAGTARLRLAFSAGQPDDEIERLAALVRTLR
jgi:8-amino-7-oxononanoate synthase